MKSPCTAESSAISSLIHTRPLVGSIRKRPRAGRFRWPVVRMMVCGCTSRYAISHGWPAEPIFATVNLDRGWLSGRRNMSARIGTLRSTRELVNSSVSIPLTTDTFTSEEARALAPYFTNTDRPVFALINLPETVKGALFARYSRSAKSLRRLFLDEFLGDISSSVRLEADSRSG